MPNATVEQVVDAVIKKRQEKKSAGFFADIFWDFKMSNEEAKKFLLSENTNKKNSVFSGLEQLKNFSFTNILKPLFNTDLSKLKTYLEVNKDNAFALWKLKQQIERQQKFNIELAIQWVKSSKYNQVRSNLSHEINRYDEYIWPYSLEYYDKMKTAQKLGDIIVKKWPIKQSSENYCGAGVRSILTRYMWFSWFPTSWANWETRDTILEERNITTHNWKRVIFKKVEVKSPYDAKAWCVIPYEANAELWTPARKKSGHVEIKWNDWNYYFDRKGLTPWWSARVSFAEAKKMTAEEYRRKTGFQGYVYYPVIEGELEQAA